MKCAKSAKVLSMTWGVLLFSNSEEFGSLPLETCFPLIIWTLLGKVAYNFERASYPSHLLRKDKKLFITYVVVRSTVENQLDTLNFQFICIEKQDKK